MSCKRRVRSFVRHRASRRRIDGGVPGGNAAQSGSVASTWAMVSLASPDANGRWPASISNRTTPKAQMSARLSTRFPFACSGAM